MSDPLMTLTLLAIILVEYFLLGYPMKEIGTDVLIFVIVYQVIDGVIEAVNAVRNKDFQKLNDGMPYYEVKKILKNKEGTLISSGSGLEVYRWKSSKYDKKSFVEVTFKGGKLSSKKQEGLI